MRLRNHSDPSPTGLLIMNYLFHELYEYNDWANSKIFSLCDGLSESQLDEPREIGFGTLRATLFHILSAEEIWLERWQGVPWRPFETDPQGASLSEVASRLQKVGEARRAFVDEHRSNGWAGDIEFQDSTQADYKLRLSDLILHVYNHGVHHRAQALNYLKKFDRTVVAGIDYLFFRLAEHAVEQSAEAAEGLRGYGLEVGSVTEKACTWDAGLVTRMFKYHDWANAKVLGFVSGLGDDDLDREFDMGLGSIRKTFLHLFDAENWWLKTWTTGPNPFPRSDAATSISDLSDNWQGVAKERDDFVATIDESSAQRVIEILAGGPATRFRVGESAVHLATHGVHHRAQLINMCRHVNAPWTNIDLLYGLAEL